MVNTMHILAVNSVAKLLAVLQDQIQHTPTHAAAEPTVEVVHLLPMFVSELMLETHALTYEPSVDVFQQSLQFAFDSASVYARTFERFRVFYRENESLDLDALRDEDHGVAFFAESLEKYHGQHEEALAIKQKRHLGMLLRKIDAIIAEAQDAQFKLEFIPSATTE
ncbi:unnamed protein product, partial [Coregonus sp. 'balchen']